MRKHFFINSVGLILFISISKLKVYEAMAAIFRQPVGYALTLILTIGKTQLKF